MAEAMSITRRRFLKVAPPTAAIATAALVSGADAAPEMTARERVDWLLAELKVAVCEANPNVRIGDIFVNLEDENSSFPLMMMCQWARGKYEGDGIYAGGSEYSRRERYQVKALDEPIKGERAFSVIKVGEKDRKMWMRLNESRFESFIGKRVGPLKGVAA